MRLLLFALLSLTTILSAKAFVAPPVNQETTLTAQAKWEAATTNELAKTKVIDKKKKKEDKSTLGIFSLLSGALSIILFLLATVGGVSIGGVLPFIFGLAGLGLGLWGLRKIKKGISKKGKGLAIAGIVLSSLTLAAYALFLAALISL